MAHKEQETIAALKDQIYTLEGVCKRWRQKLDEAKDEHAALVAALTAERDRLAAELAQEQSLSDCANGRCYCATLAAQRDDLAAKLAAAQAELHDLRIRGGAKHA